MTFQGHVTQAGFTGFRPTLNLRWPDGSQLLWAFSDSLFIEADTSLRSPEPASLCFNKQLRLFSGSYHYFILMHSKKRDLKKKHYIGFPLPFKLLAIINKISLSYFNEKPLSNSRLNKLALQRTDIHDHSPVRGKRQRKRLRSRSLSTGLTECLPTVKGSSHICHYWKWRTFFIRWFP